MPQYQLQKFVEVGLPGELLSDNGGRPDFSRSIGASGWGIGLELSVVGNLPGNDRGLIWAQPCVVANNPLDPLAGELYAPIGGAGQIIIPGPRYVWSRRELALDALAASPAAASQIDLGIALWRRNRGAPLLARVFRITI